MAGFSLMDKNGSLGVERWAGRGQQVKLHTEMHDDGEQGEREQGQADETEEIVRGEFADVAFHGDRSELEIDERGAFLLPEENDGGEERALQGGLGPGWEREGGELVS